MTFTLPAPDGFSLDAAAAFTHTFPGTRTRDDGPGTLDYSWALDGDWRTVAVSLTQHGEEVHGEVEGAHDRALAVRVRREVEQILGLDVDASGLAALGRRDPVVGEAMARRPGLRPVLFYTPYEAAAWCVIGHRISMSQAATIKQRLAHELGERGAFPSPATLAGIEMPQRGLTEQKVGQLRSLAKAASEGALDRDHLRSLPLEEAEQELLRLPGIGPFSAELVLARGVGAPDLLPRHEKRIEALVREAYALGPDDDLTAVSDTWRPYRSWVGFLLRAAA